VLAVLLWSYVLISRAMGSELDVVAWPGGPVVPYWAALVVTWIVWMIALDAADSRDEHVVGQGITEYDRVFRATLSSFALTIIFAFFFRVDLARTILLVVYPVGLVLLVVSRWLWRQWLRKQQRAGRFVHRAVVIGELRKSAHIIKTLNTSEGTGVKILGLLTEQAHGAMVEGVPVLGRFRDLERVAEQLRVDVVVLSGADDISPKVMRRIGWNMASLDVDWIVAPSLTDVAGPRIHSRPMAGLPLVHVDYPRLDGARRFLKRSFDLVGSTLLILVLSPVLIGTAIAVKATSAGPIFYTQERVGRNGVPFGMLKYRSMVTDADAQLAALLEEQGRSDQPLFKIENDPRITAVGKVMRKYSLDELPQLFNVLRGQMSLVGPRPQRDAEVALYDDDAHRRLMVKPGMSGLWQVSGRSTLSWEDTIRLDLYYVENWSFMQDIVILFRTIKAVVAPGASAH
jgi:exopolysaccharide biosynthesis polyprenyl glycosylphosphotransferase